MPGISDLLDSDMETNNFIDENSLISSVSDTTSIQAAAAKKPKKRKCVTMPKKPRAKTTTATESNATTKPKAKKTSAKRKAADANDEDTPEDELVETAPPKPRGRPKQTKDKAEVRVNVPAKPVKTKKPKKEVVEDEIVNEEEPVPSPVAIRSNFAQTKTTKSAPKPTKATKTKPTAQRPQKTVARAGPELLSDAEEEEDDLIEQEPPRKRMRTESLARQQPAYRRRAGSMSDTERGDPMLRRKLGDITRKYENMDLKYRHLKDVAVSEANTNVEKLRKQCEAITEASNKLVASLKKELAMQAPLVQKARKTEKDAQAQDAEVDKLRAANQDISTTLAAAQNEIKSLQAKLATARATPAPVEAKPPPTTSKAVVQLKQAMASNTESEKISQLKIDLYGDLTGLIIRSVKQAEDGDTYDCIQTGRNGTLHFKLFVDQDNAKKASFEETEFLYTPLLDANRDRDLIEMMPDYLAEDITFEREVAAKFYARVVKTLTERPSVDESE
ncbi:hypothetical protein PMZ80_008007 [Knufia obscura]|uniref:Monopolin complex subunit Csm1/Pcs1 C-terminal domain-containing protein n=2 Tax=Knufia TaxID=430999 RepID=A0AAN8EJT2_9EURO|nr:hypothetical protein PMZ80_008007 [Knufia obscura]KAK5957264.1 hypothetical protein OHC33_001636 [Knufia fluminis]